MLAKDLVEVLGYRGYKGVAYHCTDEVYWATNYQSTTGPSRLISDEDLTHVIDTTKDKEHVAGLTAQTAIDQHAKDAKDDSNPTRRLHTRRRSRRDQSHSDTEQVSGEFQPGLKAELQEVENELQKTKARLRSARRLIGHYRQMIDEELA